MAENEPWSYHPDGSPVYALADIIRKRAAATPAAPKGVELTGRNLGCALHELHTDIGLDTRFTLLGPADHRPADHVPAEEFEHRLRSAGRPMAGSPVRVVDPVTLEDCAPGQRGEVIVSGSRVMKGYWRKPEQTAEIMLPGGWLRTGDGGSFDADGFLYLHDRLKDMIVTGGENVYPAELIAWTRDRLAHFKCPAGVTFVPSLARTASGKLQKQAIRASLREGLRALR